MVYIGEGMQEGNALINSKTSGDVRKPQIPGAITIFRKAGLKPAALRGASTAFSIGPKRIF
jgi:hypothetical protein